jgi:ABC-type antimicrobial peptide transport system permease subunit
MRDSILVIHQIANLIECSTKLISIIEQSYNLGLMKQMGLKRKVKNIMMLVEFT